MGDGWQSPGTEKKVQESEEDPAELFKPNQQTHEDRLADPWTIKNSITGEGTSWYVPPATNTGDDAGQNDSTTHQPIDDQAPAQQLFPVEKCHYTAPPHKIPFFVSPNPPEAGPVMTPAEHFFATTVGYAPPQVLFGVPRHIFADPGYGTEYAAYPPPVPGMTDNGQPLRSANKPGLRRCHQQDLPIHESVDRQTRLRQRLGSKADWRFPAAEQEMRSDSPPSEATTRDPPAESGQQKAGPGRDTSSPSKVVEVVLLGLKGSCKSDDSEEWTGLGHGLWPLKGLANYDSSPPKSPSPRPQSRTSTRLASLVGGEAALEQKKRDHARLWSESKRQIFHQYFIMYKKHNEMHLREAQLQHREAATDNAQRAVQQRLAELEFERAGVIRRSAEKDKQVKNARDQCERYKERIVALQTQVNNLQRQNMQRIRQAAFQQDSRTGMPVLAAQHFSRDDRHRCLHAGSVIQQLAYHTLQQPEDLRNAPGQQFAIYPGCQQQDLFNNPASHTPAHPEQQYQDCRDYLPPPTYCSGNNEAIVPSPEALGDFLNAPPMTPIQMPRGINIMTAWDNNEVHNMHQEPDSFFSNAGSFDSSASTSMADDSPCPLFRKQSPRTALRRRMSGEHTHPASIPNDRATVQNASEHVSMSASRKRASINIVPHPIDDIFMPSVQPLLTEQQNMLQTQYRSNKTYTNLPNTCFSKIEAVVRRMTIAPVVRKVRLGDKDAMDFIELCQMHLGSHVDAWEMLQNDKMRQYLIIGAVQHCVVEYTMLDSILTEFECPYQQQFTSYSDQEEREDEEESLDSVAEGRYYTAHQRAGLATIMAGLPQFSDWLRQFTEATLEHIMHDIKPAFMPAELPWLKHAMWLPVHEALSIGVRMLQDPRTFDVCFPRLGTAWDDKRFVHRNPELVGQRPASGVVHCALRPLITVTSYAEDDPMPLIIHRAEVILR